MISRNILGTHLSCTLICVYKPDFSYPYYKNRMQFTHDVIVIGGGIAGLYAAQECIVRGASVMLLEKSERIGGRLQTIYQDGYHYEAGAGRYSNNHVHLRKLLKRYRLTEVPNSKQYRYNGHASPVQPILKQLMTGVQHISKEELIHSTFKQICERVIGRQKTALLINAFGYNAEFDLANAHTAIQMFTRDFMTRSYFSCKEGYGELIKRMEALVRWKGTIHMSTTVHNIEQRDKHCFVHASDAKGMRHTHTCKAVICAIPQKELLELEQFDASQRALLRSVTPVSLHRIYGQFPHSPKPWFAGMFRTSTDDPIRQFIPVDKKHGIAMLSYSDTRYADEWKRHVDKGQKHLQAHLLNHLRTVFPQPINIPAPNWIRSFYWQEGVHLWKKGIDVDDIMPKVQFIFGKYGRVFVAGEAYSKIQGWIEGALESVDEIMTAVMTAVHSQKKKLNYAVQPSGKHTT